MECSRYQQRECPHFVWRTYVNLWKFHLLILKSDGEELRQAEAAESRQQDNEDPNGARIMTYSELSVITKCGLRVHDTYTQGSLNDTKLD